MLEKLHGVNIKEGRFENAFICKKRFSNTRALNACFFFVRQYRPLINQIIFQKHCFNYTTLLNKLILYQEAMKFNMYEV